MECLTPQSSGADVLVIDNSRPRRLRSQVIEVLERGGRRVIVDCDGWLACDVITLCALVQSASACRAHGASFELQNLTSEVRAQIEDLRLTSRLFPGD